MSLTVESRKKLGNIDMPYLGFGTYQISEKKAKVAVVDALKAGYRHIDTAEGYRNEAGIGEALKISGVPREEIFITSKVWPGGFMGAPAKTGEEVIAACDASLKSLGTDYIDLYLIHGPFAGPGEAGRVAQWRAMEQLKQDGKVKEIGVSNYSEAHIEELKVAGLSLPAANQIELHPCGQRPTLVPYLEANNVAIIAYSSLAPLPNWRQASSQKGGKTEPLELSPVTVVAQELKVSEAQVLLRWALQKGYPILPKSLNPTRQKSNMDLYGFELSATHMSALDSLEKNETVAWSAGFDPLTMVP